MDTSQAHPLLKSHPLALLAHQTLRRSIKSPAYFENWDRFSGAWSKPLGIQQQADQLSGANIGAGIDALFEGITDQADLPIILRELDEITERDKAASFLARYADHKELTLREAVNAQLAYLTQAGLEQLGSNPALAEMWLDAWQSMLSAQNRQQVEHSTLSLAADRVIPVKATFSAAVDDYISRFGDTSTLGVQVIGALPFSPHISQDLIAALKAMLAIWNPMLRMVSDAAELELDEKLNAGIFATASLHQKTLLESQAWLCADELAAQQVHHNLRENAQRKLAETDEQVGELLSQQSNPSVQSMMRGLHQVLRGISAYQIGLD